MVTGGEHGPPAGLPEGQSHSESQNDMETQLAEVEEAGGQPRAWWESSATADRPLAASGSWWGATAGGQRASWLEPSALEACGDSAPLSCEGKLGVALGSLQGRRDLT